MSGTVNISRDIWDDTAFKAQPFTEREAFMWLIMEASWKPREKRVGSVVVSLDRGQVATSLRFMGDAWDWPKSTVDRFLKRLEKRDMIGTADGTGVTVITIRKYNEYQGGEKQSGTPENQKAGQQRDSGGTNEKKGLIPDVITEEAKASSSRKRASRLPADWFLPMEWGQWAVSEGMTESDIRSESEKFKDYWHARAGPTASKLDWQATWRNWVRTALERKPQLTAIAGGKNDRQRFDTAHREYTRRIAAGEIQRGPDPSDPFAGR